MAPIWALFLVPNPALYASTVDLARPPTVEETTCEAIEVARQRLRIPAIGLIVTGLIDLLGIVGMLLLVGYFTIGHGGFGIIPVPGRESYFYLEAIRRI